MALLKASSEMRLRPRGTMGSPAAATTTRSSSSQGCTVRSDSWQGPSINPKSNSKAATRAAITSVLAMATWTCQFCRAASGRLSRKPARIEGNR